MSIRAQAPTPFGEESSNSQHDIMQELQSLRDKIRDIIRDSQCYYPKSNGPFNCSRTTEFHQRVATTKSPTSNFKLWPKEEEAPRGTLQPPTKPKMEERRRIISNPPKCFECNSVGHYASSCLTKRALIFREDLNGWIEKEEDESGKCVEGEENGEDDEHGHSLPKVPAINLGNSSPLTIRIHISSFYHGSVNRVNACSENNHRSGNFTPKDILELLISLLILYLLSIILMIVMRTIDLELEIIFVIEHRESSKE
ncbi:hypothetical protein M9H77_35974 [Catharanthus roseus]|uniref:Uncharacterized protein n=1 Tax=Catharanthus roseus TaxID=4058 RepID=A0ACB9ZQJ1_CATRO|nr:hypothetical protein M9H77_35974 [Catharanthus roseus]